MARASNPDQDSSTVTPTDGCPECGGDVRPDDAAGGRVCADCGLVVDDDPVDRGPEWRAFDPTERDQKSRVGNPISEARHDNGLTTTIGWSSNDANGTALSASQRNRAKRLRREQNRTVRRSTTERNDTTVNCEIRRLTGALDAPEVIKETAGRIAGRAREADLYVGRSLECFAAAAVYAACRQQDHPVIPGDVVDLMRDKDYRFWSAYHDLERELGLTTTPFTAAEHVPRLGDAVGLSADEVGRAASLARAASDAPAIGTPSPSGLAAGVIYYLFGDDRDVTQHALADAADVTDTTVRLNRDRVAEADLEADPT